MVLGSSNGKQPFNPDKLYFNDMDIRAWERRTAELNGLAYGEDYGYVEDEGYYEDAGDMNMSSAEYEDLLFQRTLDKIRLARATGEADVALTPEELQVYQSRLWGQRAPAARPQARVRPYSDPMVGTTGKSANASGSNSPRAKKHDRRSSIFAGKSKKEKSGNRTRATSNATESILPQAPAGFLIPGPDGQPMFAPISSYQSPAAREAANPQPASPVRQRSRHTSHGKEKHASTKEKAAGSPKEPMAVEIPPQIIMPWSDMPGAFPSSPTSYTIPISPSALPGSSSGRDHPDEKASSSKSRSRPPAKQQPPKLVPFPVTEYKHHNAEPYQYQSAGHLAQSPTSPQYARRVVSAEAPYTAMPRRVPVPVQRATTVHGMPGGYSDSVWSYSGSVAGRSEEGDAGPHQTDDSGSSAIAGKGVGKGAERRKKNGKGRRKN